MDNRWAQTRRRWLGTCAGVAGITALAGCSTSEETSGNGNGTEDSRNGAGSLGEDWPMYGVDLQNTAHQPDATGPDGGELTYRAVVDLGGYSPFPVAIVNGTIYVTSTSGRMYAVNAEEEEIIWEKEGYGAPIAHDETVYGPTDGGTMYGYDGNTGDRWESDEIESVSGLGGPLPVGANAVVASHATIWEINLDTGEYTDVIDTPDFVGGSTDLPAYHDGTMYLGRSSVLYAVDIESPQIEWTFEPQDEGKVIEGNPAASDGMVYVTSRDRKLHAIDATSGEEVWTVDTKSSIEATPAVANGLVYIGERSQVIAANATDGDIEWTAEDAVTGEPEDLVVADGICYVATRNGISAYDAVSGHLEWEYEVPGESDVRFNAPPTIFDGTIYIPSRDETLYAVEDA